MIRGRLSYNFRSCVLGVLLTLIVVMLDSAGILAAFENWLYDKRALHFQRFTPEPTDRLVHIDIDDAALETVGLWPWPRDTLAEIIDEVRLAGAEALALDIVLTDSGHRTVEGAEKDARASSDAKFAAALERFGRVLVPVSFSYDADAAADDERGTVVPEAVAALRDDLELDERAVAARLPAGAAPLTQNAYLAARRQALTDRIGAELGKESIPLETLRGRLMPRVSSSSEWETSSLARQFDEAYKTASAARELRRFGREPPTGCPPLRMASGPRVLAQFARAAGYTGFVDDLPSADAVVRGIPLWVKSDDGLLYPLMDLTLACAVFGVDVRDVRIESDRVVIPRGGGAPPVDIPARVIRSSRGRQVGTYFDIPWFGSSDWRTMYDYPRYREERRHVPAAILWGLAQSRKIVARNNAAAVQAMTPFVEDQTGGAVAKFLADAPPPDDAAAWAARVKPVVEELTGLLGEFEKIPDADLADAERVYLKSFRAIRTAADESAQFAQKSVEIRNLLAKKVVLIGSTATGALDLRPTSLHVQCPGVVIHGVALSAILTGEFWRVMPWWVSALITLGLGLLITATVSFLPPWKALVATIAVAAAYGAINAVLLFDYGNRVVGLAGPFVVIAVVWGMLTLMRFIIERTERARITKKFRGYVDPQLVEYVVQHPELSRFPGQVREMTVCFTDLAGFTTMTERLKEDAVPILGRYINRMVKVMRKHRGFLNRLMGDGIMFSYGAPLENPNHAVDAVNTVLEMQEEMTLLNAELAREGLPQLAVRGGVSTGNVVVGDSGGTEAVDYTCLGDTTNFGARLESANKYTGTKNLISARTAELLDGQFLLRPVALLQVAGKTRSVMTYEPLAKSENATDEQRKMAAMMQDVFDHYQAGRFEECIAATTAYEEAFGALKLTKLYRDTCDKYIIERAPDGFCGQIVLTDK